MEIIYIITLLVSWILSLWLYFKLYYFCKDTEKTTKESLLPGYLWYLFFYFCLFSFFLSPMSLVMVLYKYYMLKKKVNKLEQNNNFDFQKELLEPQIVLSNAASKSENIENIAFDGQKVENVAVNLLEENKQEDLVCYNRTTEVIDSYIKSTRVFNYKAYCLVSNYKYVNVGEKLIRLSVGQYFKDKDIYIYAEDEGYFVNRSSCLDKLKLDYHLYSIYKSLEALREAFFPSKFEVGEDAFTKSPYIKANMYGGNKYGYPIGDLFIRIEYVNKKHKLNVDFCSKDFQFTKNHSLLFLLDNGSVLTFSNFTRPIKYSDNYTSFFTENNNIKFRINMTTSAIMSDQDVEALVAHNFIKWQLVNDEGVVLCERDFCGKNNLSSEFERKVFQDYVSMYLSLYDDIKIDEEEELEEEKTKSSICYVYLMIDTTNNFHKIGISNNPRYREHTLQSDKPTIELLCAKEYPSRIIAESIESALHKTYSSKRIRGEWFNLSPSDIEEIKKTLC